MFRIDDPSAAVALPTPEAAGTEGYWTEGNPGGGIAATLARSSFLNMIQEELRAIVTAAGLTPSKTVYNQVLTAIETLMQRAVPLVSAAGGTADALTGTFAPVVASLTNGMALYLRAGSANATTTPTFTPNSGVITAKTIVKGNGLALVAGDIAGAGHWLDLQYDATLDKWVLLNPASGVNALGFGQAWTDVTASRALATNFTNTTGRPIEVSVKASVPAGQNLVLTVGGIAIQQQGNGAAAAVTLSVCAIVPPGVVYQASGGTSTLSTWAELR